MIISYHCAKYPQQLMWCCEIHIRLQVINVGVSNKKVWEIFSCSISFQVPCSYASCIQNSTQTSRVFHLRRKYLCH